LALAHRGGGRRLPGGVRSHNPQVGGSSPPAATKPASIQHPPMRLFSRPTAAALLTLAACASCGGNEALRKHFSHGAPQRADRREESAASSAQSDLDEDDAGAKTRLFPLYDRRGDGPQRRDSATILRDRRQPGDEDGLDA